MTSSMAASSATWMGLRCASGKPSTRILARLVRRTRVPAVMETLAACAMQVAVAWCSLSMISRPSSSAYSYSSR